MVLSDKEIEALEKKAENPTIYVKCPRCGKELKYIPYSSSGQLYAVEIRCETENCIKNTLRGF